jgi:hypothetical protein
MDIEWYMIGCKMMLVKIQTSKVIHDDERITYCKETDWNKN